MNTELNKCWFITGVTGQDGSYMCDLLLELGYVNIHGLVRRSSNFNTKRINHIFEKLKLHYGDLTDPMSLFKIINDIKPDYIVNFAAQSHVKVSAEVENYTIQTNTIGVLNILQSVRLAGLEKTCKIYQASTSEIMGNQTDGTVKLNEESPQNPCSIYGISKHAAQLICNLYRDAYGMFVVNSILYNHESPRRGGTFVTKKIIDYIKNNKGYSKNNPLRLGNLYSKRDWGYARDYVEAVYLMLMKETPKNYVISSGETHNVKEFVETAFKMYNDTDIIWKGEGVDEIGLDSKTGNIIVRVDKRYFRDLELHTLIGDSSLAAQELGWSNKTDFKKLVKIMLFEKENE